MSEDKMPLDPNSAELEALASLPGIGLSLARRIVEARPYASVEDLRRVPGLGRAKLSRLKDLLAVDEREEKEVGEPDAGPGQEAPLAEAGSPQGMPGTVAESGESLPSAPEPIVPTQPPLADWPQKPSKKDSRGFSKAETFWLILGVGVVSVLLSIGMTLAIMAGINKTLDLSRHEAVRALEDGVGRLETDMASLASRLETLDQRLSALEGLSGRMATVEAQVGVLEEQMGVAIGQVEAMQGDVEELTRQTADLAKRADVLDAFLDGLEGLLRRLREEPLPEQGIEP